MSAQAKPISQVVKDFEQSLKNLQPSTKRVYMAGARAAIRAASLELWQSPSTNELLASIGKLPTEKRARISPFLAFLGGGQPQQSVSDEDSAALQNWVIQTIAKQMRFVKNPSIATRRDTALIAAICAAPTRGTPRKWPQNCLKSRKQKCFCGTRQSRNHALLSPGASGTPGENGWPANGGLYRRSLKWSQSRPHPRRAGLVHLLWQLLYAREEAGTQRYNVGTDTPKLCATSCGVVPLANSFFAASILLSVIWRFRPPTRPWRLADWSSHGCAP